MIPCSENKRRLIGLALPIVTGFIGLMAYKLVDIFWIAKLGTEVVAGVAASEYWLWAVEAIMEMTTIGCATMIAQCVGAKDEEGARRTAREAAHLSLIISVAIMAGFYLVGPSLLRWMGLSTIASEAGWSYIRILLIGMPVLHLILLSNHIFNAHGDTKTPVIIMAIALAVNAVLDPFLIFGWWVFPKLGVAGAAYATLIGHACGLVMRVIWLRRRRFIPPLADFLSFSTGYFKRILNVGIPTAASHLIWTSVYPLLTTILTVFGMTPLAGMTIAHRFESLAYFTCLGFSIATATMVGQAVGRGDFAAAREIAYEARSLITMILIPISLLFLLVPEVFLRIMTSDPEVIAHGAKYLRIIGIFEIFLGWEMIFEGGFNGLGSTRRCMFISVPLTLGRYPAAYFLVHGLGWPVESVFWCISISTLLKGLLMSLVFRRTRAADLDLRAQSAVG